jgi:hypothetical protein
VLGAVSDPHCAGQNARPPLEVGPPKHRELAVLMRMKRRAKRGGAIQ